MARLEHKNINMGLLRTFFNFIRKIIQRDPGRVVFYKIIDATQEIYTYTLQCINTKAIFQAKINDIVSDPSLLHRLHPIQSCYIGIEYSKYIKDSIDRKTASSTRDNKLILKRSYGCYCLLYQDRKGCICFYNQKSNEEYWMDPIDVALSEKLIREFDPAQAFYIGLLAGLKINNAIKRKSTIKNSRLHLRIVK